ncbi:mycofactocin-coupled SDR family oxidoreductase [Rhodococcus sp. HM1]|uniref:mycofactocin-coupled SDR family oxidoreductase n=1 Tax=Rhodococcus sp. HM1 TaxID=2937759 RepID=UPI00200A70D9|nr:mycofactocin-coupled SDR family oxidoreductase [Rhodococcus sp. HM1]MCK8671597.1 mycofactocin-coupled SDR family oxidoreductase [Rhodococcus sp. HM1]
MGRVEGKVALITGAARGQGRAHTVRLAEEGADIIAIDVPDAILNVSYPMGTAEDLAETACEVESRGRRIITLAIDVRNLEKLVSGIAGAVAELGRLDIVSVNAAIAPLPHRTHEIPADSWQQMIDVNLTGAWNTAVATVPHLIGGGRGGSIIFTSSVAGLKGMQSVAHYSASKHGVVGLMRTLAQELAEHKIRVNSVHPTQVDTPMIQNDGTYRIFRPDLENPTRADFEPASQSVNLLPIPWVESIDVSNAVLFLASDEARYITGATLPVDAGLLVK